MENSSYTAYLIFIQDTDLNLTLDKLGFTVKFNVLNVLNTVYISDAINNDTYIQRPFNTFDARSASVFMGAGRQFSVSLKIVFN